MKKNLKIIFIVFFIPIVLLLLIVILLSIFYIYFKYTPNYYSYIESLEHNNKRYSLYYDYGRDGYSWFIFEHDINYKKYKDVERTKVSLNVYNNNTNDKFIYYFIPDNFDYKNAKIKLLKNKYLVLDIDDLYNFLYNIETDTKYDFKKMDYSRMEIHNNIIETIKKEID